MKPNSNNRAPVYRTLSLAVATAVTAISGTDASADENFMLEEVVVTAQKRAQSLQDVPMSVSAVTEDDLRNAGIQTVGDVKKRVPTLSVISSALPSRTSLKIRGAGTNPSDPTVEPSVGVVIDGVYMPRSVFGLTDLVDVERVEVLMGPQGTLYGKNTNAGVVSVTTKGMPDALEGSVEATLGDYDRRDLTFAIGAPISDSLGYRLSGKMRNRDGWLEDVVSGDEYNEVDNQAFRGQLFWEPSDALSVRAIGYYSKSEGLVGYPENHYDENGSYLATMNALAAAFGVGTVDADPDNRKLALDSVGDMEFEVKGGSVQVDYELNGGVTLTSITSYQEWDMLGYSSDADGTQLDLIRSHVDNTDESFGQEIRLTSAGGETLDWMVGAYYFTSELMLGKEDNAPQIVFGDHWVGFGAAGAPLVGHYFSNMGVHESDAMALFGQATWNLSEDTSLTFGLRYSDEEKSFDMRTDAFDPSGTSYFDLGGLAGFPANGVNPIVAQFSGVCVGGTDPTCAPVELSDEMSDDNVTGMISLNHHIGDVMLYATVSTGTKSGGFSSAFGNIALPSRSYDTEKTTNYELGAKIEGLLDGRARVNMAYFYTEYDDFQAVVWDTNAAVFLTNNAGMQITQGVNLDATVMLTQNLTLHTALEYLDATYDEFEGASCHPHSGGPVCDRSGERLEYASNWSGSIALDYVRPLDGGAELYASLSGRFKTEHAVGQAKEPFNKERNEQVDARIGWRNDNWDVALWGANLTDRIYSDVMWENVTASAVLGGLLGTSRLDYHTSLAEPRTYGVTARYSF